MERIERITYFESILDEGIEKVENLQRALDEYEQITVKIQELEAYYQSSLWREDYRADEEGRVPKDLKRGVLSEDGIFNFLTDQFEVEKRLKR